MLDNKHFHKLIRINLTSNNGKYSVFKCIVPECKFFINSKLAFGYRVVCWRCGESFIMVRKNEKQKKPHCNNCTKNTKITETIKEIL